MKQILIDARMVREIPDGIAHHVIGMVNHIARQSPPFKLVLLLSDQKGEFHFVPSPHLDVVYGAPRFLAFSEQWRVAALIRKINPVFCHFPSFVIPKGIPTPFSATIHDVHHWKYPKLYTPFHRLYYRFLVFPALQKASAISTVSEFTKKEMIALRFAPKEKIEVIPNGIDPFTFTPNLPFSLFCAVKKKYGLPPSFLLYVGGSKPHKNFENVQTALSLLTEDKRPPLVAIGAFKANVENPAQKVRQLTVQESELPAIYGLATALCYPSLYEGFGLPILEAFACGTPVITSNQTGCAEVAGDAALTVDPTNERDIATAIFNLMEDEALRERLRRRGLERKKTFSWENSAKKMINLISRFI